MAAAVCGGVYLDASVALPLRTTTAAGRGHVAVSDEINQPTNRAIQAGFGVGFVFRRGMFQFRKSNRKLLAMRRSMAVLSNMTGILQHNTTTSMASFGPFQNSVENKQFGEVRRIGTVETYDDISTNTHEVGQRTPPLFVRRGDLFGNDQPPWSVLSIAAGNCGQGWKRS